MSRLNIPSSLSCFSPELCSTPFTSSVALLWTCFSGQAPASLCPCSAVVPQRVQSRGWSSPFSKTCTCQIEPVIKVLKLSESCFEDCTVRLDPGCLGRAWYGFNSVLTECSVSLAVCTGALKTDETSWVPRAAQGGREKGPSEAAGGGRPAALFTGAQTRFLQPLPRSSRQKHPGRLRRNANNGITNS